MFFVLKNLFTREGGGVREEIKSYKISFPFRVVLYIILCKRGNETLHLIYTITLINLRFIIDWILRTLSNVIFRGAEFLDFSDD